VRVHERLPRYAFARLPEMARPLPSLGASDVAAFWRWLRAQALAGLDSKDARDLARLWPAGDAFALKQLLAMNPRASVVGIDRADDGGDLLAQLCAASAQPDLDHRDRDRLAYGPDRQPLRDRHGELVPDDPAILNMGAREGLSSQANAHYGLSPGPHSSDPEVLRSEPHRFAIARAPGVPEVLTFAPARAQLHAELALLAARWGGPGAARLAALFTGAGWHYLQDVGSQVHTVQVGLYDFFVRAKLLYWARAALTAGGYLGELKPFTAIGLDLLTNHHVFAEELGAKRLLEAERTGKGALAEALRAMALEDPEIRAEGEAFAEALVRAVIARSAPEGALVYRAAWDVSVGKLRSYGVLLPEDADPERYVNPGATEALGRLLALMGKGLRRVGTAMRCWWKAHEAAAAAPADARAPAARLFARLLRDRRAALARRQAYLTAVGAPEAGPLREPVWIAIDAGLLALVFGIAWGAARLVRRLRRRRRVAPGGR
jgi:hypothetical protein